MGFQDDSEIWLFTDTTQQLTEQFGTCCADRGLYLHGILTLELRQQQPRHDYSTSYTGRLSKHSMIRKRGTFKGNQQW